MVVKTFLTPPKFNQRPLTGRFAKRLVPTCIFRNEACSGVRRRSGLISDVQHDACSVRAVGEPHSVGVQMTTNQVKRLKALTRHQFTEPTFWREKKGRRFGGKTADELVDGLDWDLNLHGLEKVGREHAITAKFSSDLVSGTSAVELEQENQLLKRQLQVLLEQVSTGDHKLPSITSRTASINRPIRPTSSTSSHGVDEVSPLAGHRGVSGAQTDRGHYNSTASVQSGSQTDRGHSHSGVRSPLASPRSTLHLALPDGHKTDALQRLSKSKHDINFAAVKKNARDNNAALEVVLERERIEALRGKREAEKQVAALEKELKELRIQKLNVEEKVWTLEECLAAKDTDLELKQVECDHLRYLVGVKEGDEAQLERQLEFVQGHPFDEIYIESGEEPAEQGKALMRRAQNEAYKMEEFLKEMEEHLVPEQEEEHEAANLVEKCREEEERRRRNQSQAMEYRGLNGEYLLDGCPVCHRLVLVADKEVECQLIDDEPEEHAEEEPQQVEVTKRKRRVRRAVGVPPPFDQIVTSTDRWMREKPTRVTMLTDKKILKDVTTIFCEKVVADATDDKTGTARAVMKCFVHEHFLSVYGVRSLSDFYLLELVEGIKLFWEQHPRIKMFARFCELTFAGDPMGETMMDFFLEMWKEFALGMKSPAKNQRDRLNKRRGSVASVSGDSGRDYVQRLSEHTFIIDAKTKKDEKITAKRIFGWKIIRRAFERIADHKWFPPEYQSAEEIKDDALGIGQQDVSFDEILEYGMDQYLAMYNGRRERLRKLFLEGDEDRSGRLDFEEFKALMSKLDENQSMTTVLHYFRECVEGQDDDSMDIHVFCDVMQRHKLDRPKAHPNVQVVLPQDPAKQTELLGRIFAEVKNDADRVDQAGFVSAVKQICAKGNPTELATAAFAQHAEGAPSLDFEQFSMLMFTSPVLEAWQLEGGARRDSIAARLDSPGEVASRASSGAAPVDGVDEGWQ